MHFQKLDLNLLVALDVLLHEANIGNAAKRLHLSQSATSGALGRLRAYFNDPLLVQVGRKMELTPRAQILRDAAHDVLLRVDTTITARPDFDPPRDEREFCVSLSDYSLHTLIPPLHRELARRAPHVRLRLVPQVTRAAQSLERGEVDLLIIPEALRAPDHPWVLLLEERFVCVAWAQGALAEVELTPQRYAQAHHLLMEPQGEGLKSFEDVILNEDRIERRVSAVGFSFAALIAMVVGTDRITTVPERLARQASAYLPIVLKDPPRAVVMRQGLQWHKFRGGDPGIAWLQRVFRETAA